MAPILTLVVLAAGCGGGETVVDQAVVTAVSITGPFSAAAPEPFTLTGQGYDQVLDTEVTVRFTATVGAPFAGGTAASVEVPGTITGAGTLTGTSPPAVVAGGTTATARLTVILPSLAEGSSATPIASFVGPSVSAFLVDGTPPGAPLPVDVPSTVLLNAAGPETFTIQGAGFGPVGGTASVVFTAQAGTPFDGGLATAAATGQILDARTIAGALPTIGLPRLVTDFVADVDVTLANGATAPLPGAVTFRAPPTVSGVTNGRAPFDPSAPLMPMSDTFLACVSTPSTIAGTVFDAGATVLLYDAGAGPGTPVGSGQLEGSVTLTPTLITGGSPRDLAQTRPLPLAVRVLNPDGQFSVFGGLTMDTTGALDNVNASRRVSIESEMALCVNPRNPLNAAICSHNGASGLQAMLHMYTLDGGVTWGSFDVGPPASPAPDGLPANAFRFDPMVTCDAFGNIYCVYGARSGGVTSVVVQRSADGGTSFDTVILLPFASSSGLDRWSAAAGPDGATAGNQAVYVGCIDFGLPGWPIVVAGLSAAPGPGGGPGGALTPFPGYAVPHDAFGSYQHGTPAVGPGGELYMTWASFGAPSSVYVDVDPDGLGGPATFGTDRLVGTTELGFKEFIPAQVQRGIGLIPMGVVVPTGPNAGRVVVTYTTVDPIAWAGGTVDMGVVTQFSDDSGVTWSAPVLVHSGDSNDQFHPWMAVDPVNGELYVTWYDTRNDPGNVLTERYSASSADGAAWGPALLLSQGRSDVTASGGNDYLEYNGVGVVGGCVYACWADNSNVTGDNPNGMHNGDGTDVMTCVYMQRP